MNKGKFTRAGFEPVTSGLTVSLFCQYFCSWGTYFIGISHVDKGQETIKKEIVNELCCFCFCIQYQRKRFRYQPYVRKYMGLWMEQEQLKRQKEKRQQNNQIKKLKRKFPNADVWQD